VHVHVMDSDHPQRFGWRVWHLDGARLSPPIHRGKMRFGARVVESVCQHRTDPLALAPDCNCGIYFEDADRAFQRWCIEVDRVGADNVAVTFGVAVGDVAADPVLPDDAFRSPRWAILAILLPPASPAAGPVRKRYDANVHMKTVSPTAMQYVEDAVRADLRRTPSPEFFETLRAEPAHAQDWHVMDRSPERFGWCLWRLHPDPPALSVLESPREIACRRTSSGRLYFEDEGGPGLIYHTSGFYCARQLGVMAQAYSDAGWSDVDGLFAVTYGIADGAIATIDGTDGHRSRRHFPGVMCIPPSHEGLKPAMERDWGMGAVPALSTYVFHDLEKLMRTKLAHMSDDDLRRTLKR